MNDELFMDLALKAACKSLKSADVPIGAIITIDDKVMGVGFNQIEKTGDPTAHAEMFAIQNAVKNVGHKHLIGATMYVTLEPCAMCAGAIVLARIDRLVIGADDPKTGACGSLRNIPADERLNHRCKIERGVLREECSQLIKYFFSEIRRNKKK